MNKSKYVKCIYIWHGLKRSVVGKIYDTSVKPDFSVHDWKDILTGNRVKDYFVPCDEYGNEITSDSQQIDTQFKFML